MSTLYVLSEEYQPVVDVQETEKAIKIIKDFFQENLGKALNLRRVTAPLFVKAGTGVNDDLNGVEKPVSFRIKNIGNIEAQIVQSLAKWKRLMLAELKINHGEGLYTDMNAIRPDEILDNLHSLYVDQWDWERVISSEERNVDFLKAVVRKIYRVMKKTEMLICGHYPKINPLLPEEIHFIHSEELEDRFPQLTPREREDAICRQYGAVFVIGIGAPLKNGQPHDGRAPDYDDWTTANGNGKGLNGDILVWYPLMEKAYEISSMGIRVDPQALERQLAMTRTTERSRLWFHHRLLRGELPLSIGGGIGQSRLCALFLHKAHIGEVQSSIWPDEMIEECKKQNIFLL
jgi:aspartate--ammonia ligase